MSDPAIQLITALLEAVADAHTRRSLVPAIARAFDSQLPIRGLELRIADHWTAAILTRGEWVIADRDPGARSIAEGLAVTATKLPAFVARDDVRAALDQVVVAASRHLDVVERLAQTSRRAHADNRELRAGLDRDANAVIARSPAMRAVLSRVELVARHPTTVLLEGESGSGKEVIAREIHRRSRRANRPLIQLNCGAIPDGLVESELFGHERGAFTGADRVHAGVFERANGATLLLDEIGELPAPAQAKLLRVLQERRIRRVGGEVELEVDVRLIAATNRKLSAMVERGVFREDLYYRLAVFAIDVPPLRERRADIAPLVAALTTELAGKLDLPAPAISKATLSRLEAHDWPGNVRELMNTLESAIILGGGTELILPQRFVSRTRTAASDFASAARVAIEDALRTTRGKIYGSDGAAARLGLKPGTLQSKMRKLGIERAPFVGS